MIILLLKGFFIGVLASVSLGPVAMQVLRKSLNYGIKAGSVTGLGAGVGDTTFAAISLVAFAVAQNFIDDHKFAVYLICGCIITVLGILMIIRDPFRERKGRAKKLQDRASMSFFGQGLLTDISNPGALVVMMTLFGFFNVDVSSYDIKTFLMLPCVYAGTAVYWHVFAVGASRACANLNVGTLRWVNRIMGSIVVCLGVYLITKGLI